MEILKQCQIWHESNEYQQIIDTLEALPAEERTPEIDSELARAYNNQADPTKPEGINMLKRAVSLLAPHEEYFQGEHFWNFRMGYAYYYLDQEGVALRYFEKALETRPGDEDSQWFIDACRKQLALPHFEKISGSAQKKPGQPLKKLKQKYALSCIWIQTMSGAMNSLRNAVLSWRLLLNISLSKLVLIVKNMSSSFLPKDSTPIFSLWFTSSGTLLPQCWSTGISG